MSLGAAEIEFMVQHIDYNRYLQGLAEREGFTDVPYLIDIAA
jgi:hypothetical protein